jgi:inner membrane transporter RhtA
MSLVVATSRGTIMDVPRSAPTTRRRSPALVLVGTAAVSVQSGAAVAFRLFARVGPSGAVTLRLVLAAVVMSAGVRPRLRSMSRRDLGVAAAFGLVLAAMNLSFYEALDRIPLGVAVTVEFAGPLAVAVFGSRRKRDLIWAVLAGGGVVILAGGDTAHLDPVGLGLALLAGSCWAGYILLSRETGRRFDGLDGLTVALGVGGLALLPFGLEVGRSALVRPRVLGLGLVVAMLSAVLPYSLELITLRRVTARAFGVLLSLDPAVAAGAGLVLLGQRLVWIEVLALTLVVAANLGSAITA